MEWTFLTRREDHEDHEEHHGMIATTECLRAGTSLLGGIDIDTHASDLEKSALGLGLALWQKRAMLGGENRRGLGRAVITIDGAPDPTMYHEWLAANKDNVLAYLTKIGALL
jgi:hypothetical protein